MNLADVKKLQAKAKRASLESLFFMQLKAVKLDDGCETQYKFNTERKWRFDFAWPNEDVKLAIEVDGGTHTGGRHVRGAGYAKDCEKSNTAAAMGWTLFRFTSDMIKSGKAILFVEDYLRTKVG